MSRANCNKIIMLFTDGGEERAQAILEKYNAEKKVTSRTRDLSASHSQTSCFYFRAVWFKKAPFERLSGRKAQLFFRIFKIHTSLYTHTHFRYLNMALLWTIPSTDLFWRIVFSRSGSLPSLWDSTITTKVPSSGWPVPTKVCQAH